MSAPPPPTAAPVSTRAPAADATPFLTAYETAQIRAISAWKAQQPGLTRSLLGFMAAPIEKIAQQVIPAAAAKRLMALLNAGAEQSVADHWVLRIAGVQTYAELRSQPLAFCDALADRAIGEGRKLAVGVGAVTGTGGLPTAAVGISALLTAALRVIHRVAQSYGYPVQSEVQREVMLHILALSTAATPAERRRALSDYQRQVQTYLIDEAVHDAVMATLQRVVLRTELAGSLPGIGLAVNAYIHRAFVSRAGVTGKRVFQECWLRDRRGLAWIEPA